jgi:hypothetical protein
MGRLALLNHPLATQSAKGGCHPSVFRQFLQSIDDPKLSTFTNKDGAIVRKCKKMKKF